MRGLLLGVVFAGVLVAIGASASGSDARAETLRCGQLVSSSVSLDRNLKCTGDGLIVVADNVVIDLNGYTISGGGSGNGISVGEFVGGSDPRSPCINPTRAIVNGTTVENGTIKGFSVGIAIQPESKYTSLAGLNVASNTAGGIVAKTICQPEANWYTSVTDSRVHDNGGIGIDLGDGGYQAPNPGQLITGSEVFRNAGDGIEIHGYSDTTTIDNNNVHDNGGDGITSGNSTSIITNNLVTDNGGMGINAQNYGVFSWAPNYWIADNTVKRNGSYGILVNKYVRDGGGNVAKNNNGGADQCVDIACGQWNTTAPHCGDTLTVDTQLRRDLVCLGPGTALTLAEGVALDLNGHTIQGPGPSGSDPLASVGIQADIYNLVEGGTVSGFDSGVFVDGPVVTLRGLTISGNQSGIYDTGGQDGTMSVITESQIVANDGDGILAAAGGAAQFSQFLAKITDNTIDHNGGNGINVTLFSNFATISGNSTSWNGGDGIRLSNADATVSGNTASDNGKDGIEIRLYQPAGASDQYTLTGNLADTNASLGIDNESGLAVDGGGNSASGNGNPLECLNVLCAP